ncbi:MAG: hypothetical protein WCX46_04200 [Candidatus Paceibacterota bacterium]
MYSRSLEEIKKIFKDKSDGIRIVMLSYRKKEGGTNHRTQHSDFKKVITTNSEEFFNAIDNLQQLTEHDARPLRIYASVNSRNLDKAIHKFKQEQLDNEYSKEKSVIKNFYLDIRNQFVSCLMKKSSRAESSFLFDLDGCDDRSFHTIYNQIEKLTKIQMYYQTKNGYHIITEPFNYNKLECRDQCDIHPDALMLIDF